MQEGETTFPMFGTTSYIYKGSCEAEHESDMNISPFRALSQLIASVPDEHVSTRTNSDSKSEWRNQDDR